MFINKQRSFALCIRSQRKYQDYYESTFNISCLTLSGGFQNQREVPVCKRETFEVETKWIRSVQLCMWVTFIERSAKRR